MNQLTRKSAARIAAAVAHHLWFDRPLVGRVTSTESCDVPRPRRGGPMVVIGQDSRTSSSELSVGVGASLRRMGCEVVDVGCVSGPCLTFSVEHLQASAGIYVTGSGCPDSWTGLDLIGQGGVPWSMEQTLTGIERLSMSDIPRPTRRGGTQRYFDASLPYRAGLLKHYQELRPMRLACVCPERTVLEAVTPLFEGLPCELTSQDCSPPKRGSGRREDLPHIELRTALQESSADYAVLLDGSGLSVTLMAADGCALTNVDMLRRIASRCMQSQSPLTVVVGEGIDVDVHNALTPVGAVIVEAGEGSESMARAMQESGAGLGVQAGGRFWFRDPFPRCDALLTLGRLLQSLSREGSA